MSKVVDFCSKNGMLCRDFLVTADDAVEFFKTRDDIITKREAKQRDLLFNSGNVIGHTPKNMHDSSKINNNNDHYIDNNSNEINHDKNNDDTDEDAIVESMLRQIIFKPRTFVVRHVRSPSVKRENDALNMISLLDTILKFKDKRQSREYIS